MQKLVVRSYVRGLRRDKLLSFTGLLERTSRNKHLLLHRVPFVFPDPAEAQGW